MPDPNSIVTVKVSTILAPSPSKFQQSGALVSFGASILAPNTTSLLTQFSDLQNLIQPAIAISNIIWAGGIVTVTTVNPLPPGIVGSVTPVKIAVNGNVPASYNGIFNCTVTGTNTFTYTLSSDPGLHTVLGTAVLYSAVDLNAQAATFFRQGTAASVYILELGYHPNIASQLSAIENWLTNNALTFYGYLMPSEWGLQANLTTEMSLFMQYTNPESMTYFWITIEQAAIGIIPASCKSVIQLIEAPTVAASRALVGPNNFAEFTLAGVFFWAMQFQATSVTRVSPMCFKFIYGVTPYPTQNNGPLLVSFKDHNVNYIQTGAEGGIAFTYVYQGVTTDGMDYFNWWWTIDWVQINIDIDLTNAIVNGSNNPLAPLYYDQPGINQLEAVLAGTMRRASSFGMVNGLIVQTELTSPQLSTAISQNTFEGQCNVNAVPFIPYSEQNPSHYGKGEYDGLSTLFIPARGFVHILVVVVATDIVTL